MKKLLFILLFLICFVSAFAQTKYPLPYDTVIVMKPTGTGYLKAAKGNFQDSLWHRITLALNDSSKLAATTEWVKRQLYGSGGGTPSLPNRSVQLNQNGSFHGSDSMIYNNGALILKHNDSIGAILNYAWNQTPLNTWIDQTSTATVTTDGVSTTISGAGLGLNLNNALTLQRYVGVWNYTITGSVKITQKDATSYGFMINIPPSTGMGTGVSAQFLLQQSQGFISYNAQTVTPDSVISSKGTCKLIWAVNDTLDVSVQRVETYFIFTMTNRRNGSQCSLTVSGIFAQVGQPAIYFYSPTKLIGNFKITYNEILNPQLGLMGNSIASGGVATTSLYKYYSILQDKLSAYGINLCGPGELSLDGTYRVGDMLSAHSKVLLYGYGVNDYSNSVPLDSFSKRVQRTIVPAIADGQTVVIVNLTPQSSGSLVTYNDTLQAIATRYGLRYVDIFTLLKGSGTAMNPIYDGGDGVHPNNAGHAVIAAAILNKISDLITPTSSSLIAELPLSNSLQDRFVVLDGNNNFRYRPNVSDSGYIFNQPSFNTQTVQTGAIFNITGSGAVGDNFIVRGAGGSFGAPIFSANDPAFADNIVRALTFKTQNFYSSPGSLTGFDAGLVRFSSGAYIDALTQPFVISNRNHNSTTGNTIFTNLDNGFDLTPSYQWLMAYKTVSTVKDTVFFIDRGGGGHFDSTIVTPNIFTANSDSTAWKPVVVDASGNQRKGFWIGGSGVVTSVSGTSNRITSTGGTTPVIDISATFEALLGKVANPLSQFASTTSAQLLGVLSDETGSGLSMFNNTPTIITPSFTTGFTIGGAATSGKFIVGNGTNYIASTSTIPTSAGATANKLLLSDGTNYVLSTPTFPNASATTRKIIVSDGTNWIASTETYAVPGTSGNVLKSDGTNWTSAAPAAASLTVGSTTVASGSTTNILYNNAGVLGEYTISGTGTVVAMQTSPSFTTPTLGVASATSINKLTITAPATSATLTIVDGGSLITAGAFATTITSTATTNATLPSGTGTLAYLAGANTWTGIQTFNSGVSTGTTSTSGVVQTNNSLTSGTGEYMSSSSITSGNLLNIITTGTVAAAGNEALNIDRSGANGASAITVTGERISVTNTGTTSVNVGLEVAASGASTNYAIRSSGDIVPVSNGGASLGTNGLTYSFVYFQNLIGGPGVDLRFSSQSTNNILFQTNSTSNTYVEVFGSTGNMALQNGGSFTDNGSRLQTTSFSSGYVAKTANYTATTTDYTINCTSGTFQVTLPTAVGCAGRIYVVTNSGAGTITIGTTSSQTFANFTATPTTLTMAVVGSRTVQSNGANWLLLSSL